MADNDSRGTKWLNYVLSVSLLLMILYVGVRYNESILNVLDTSNPYWLVAGALCYGCNYLFRSLRIWHFAGKKDLFFPAYVKVAGLHGFNSYFFPLRSGDLTLPLLLRLHLNISLSRGSRFLLRARMLDIFCLGFLLFGATIFTETTIDPLLRAIFWAIGLGFIVFPYGAVFVMGRKGGMLPRRIQVILGEGKPKYPNLFETLISLAIWFWTGSTIFCVIRSLEIPLSFMDVWFLAAIQLPLQLFPVQGVANAGNHEAGWVAGLGMLGISFDSGLPFALASHAIIICYVVLLGVVAALLPSSYLKSSRASISGAE